MIRAALIGLLAATIALAPALARAAETGPIPAVPAAPPSPPEREPPRAPATDPDEVRRFADALLAEGDHYRAIGEYKRYLFLAPDAADRAGARLAIGRAYLLGDRAADAALWFEGLAAAEADPRLVAAWRFQAGLARMADEDWAGAAADFAVAADGLPRHRSRALTLRGFSLAADDRDEEAVATLHLAAAAPGADSLPAALAAELARRDELVSTRSPLAAGVLSAILPGAGHAYVGDPGLAITALAWNGLFAWGLVEAIDAKLWGVAATLGVLELLFYGGAIAGAVAGAHKYNRDARLNHLDDLRRRHPELDVRRSTIGDGEP